MNYLQWNPKFIYRDWEPDLEGKVVFGADSLERLEEKFNLFSQAAEWEPSVVGTASPSDYDELPFSIESSPGNSSSFTLAYHDPFLFEKFWHTRGAPLEYHDSLHGWVKWVDFEDDTDPYFDCRAWDFRIRPAAVPKLSSFLDEFVSNHELSMWLAKGKGEYVRLRGTDCLDRGEAQVSTIHEYTLRDANQQVGGGILVRPFGTRHLAPPTRRLVRPWMLG